ncbi:MAG: glycoside hydrolase family 95-like protein, partial [Hyphomicrobium sp.]
NFGGAAGIAEMLIQSHEGDIHLLPALPSAWPNSDIRNRKAGLLSLIAPLAWRERAPPFQPP